METATRAKTKIKGGAEQDHKKLSASRIGKKSWHKCIISGGDYFEGDKIDIHE